MYWATDVATFGTVVSIVAGLVLFFGASFKVVHLLSDPWAGDLLFQSRRLFVAMIEFEFLAGVVLIVSRRNVYRRCGAALFSLLGCVSIYQWMNGAAGCECFGSVSIPPSVMSGVDLTLVVALGMTRHRSVLTSSKFEPHNASVSQGNMSGLQRMVLGVAVCCGLFSAWAAMAALAEAQVPRRLSPATIRVVAPPGAKSVDQRVRLMNRLGIPVESIKVIPNCSCSSSSLAKTALDLNEEASFKLHVDLTGRNSSFAVLIAIEYLANGKWIGELLNVQILLSEVS